LRKIGNFLPSQLGFGIVFQKADKPRRFFSIGDVRSKVRRQERETGTASR